MELFRCLGFGRGARCRVYFSWDGGFVVGDGLKGCVLSALSGNEEV